MPIFDRRCPSCGWERDDCYEPVVFERACDACGKPTERVYRVSAAVIGDDPFIGGKTFEHMGHEPVTVHSRSEYRRELQKRGLQEFVRHAPMPGTDKSDKTTRWT